MSTLRINTPDGPIEFAFEADEQVAHVSTVAGHAHALADALGSATSRAVERRGLPVTCGHKCAACCRHLVAVTPLEAFILADAVQKLPPDLRDRIQQRTEAAVAQLEASGLNERIDTIAAGEAGRQVVRDYFHQQIACPMLEDESCSVYEARPAKCRQLMVVSDPQACSRPQDGQVQSAPVILDLTAALERLSQSVFADHPQRMPLVRALTWVADNDALWEVGATGVNLVNALMQALGSKPSPDPAGGPG